MENNLIDKNKFIIKKSMPYIWVFVINFYLVIELITVFSIKVQLITKIGIIGGSILIIILINYYILKTNTKEVELIKNINNNTLQIRTFNLLKQIKSEVYLNLSNISFYDLSFSLKSSKGKTYREHGLAVISTYNQSEIDLDTSNIKNIPKKIFYLIKDIEKKKIKNEVSDFVGVSPESDNPVFLNIDKYMGRSYEKKLKYVFGEYHISKYMKVSDHFFSYYFNEKDFSPCCLIWINIIFGILAIPLFAIFVSDEKTIYKVIFVCSYILFLFIIDLIDCCAIQRRKAKKILRIDIIFSKNFDKIFIGLVNLKEDYYLKTFTYDVNLIDKFMLETRGKKKNNLNIALKNQGTQNICFIDDSAETLEGLIFILNEKLNKNNEYNSNPNYSQNLLVKNWD